MIQDEFIRIVEKAAAERACKVFDIMYNDDDNVFEVTIEKLDASAVDLADCVFVHRAVLAAFDRNIEDYALTVGSRGIDAAEADEMLKTINEE